MSLRLAAAPAGLPLSLAEIKAHLRVDHSDEDVLLDVYNRAAMEYVEHFTRRSLMPQTWTYSLDSFPAQRMIRLSRSPYNEAHSALVIKYDDADGAEQTLAASEYTVDGASIPARVRVGDNGWPETLDDLNAVRITYGAGYADAASVPTPLKQAMLLMIGHWFANREAVVVGTIAAEVPLAAKALMRAYRTGLVL